MNGRVLVAIGALWFVTEVAVVFWSEKDGYGFYFDLPFPPTVQNVMTFVLSSALILGWLPTLAVGIYRLTRGK